nr:immunoglobulin heavy chain junction region [Mus musculus]NSM04434.1 immunoglobulin heavy chain junction region [Mus musculus]NSM04793.1 immunoglobulin heavy chain junction region [Mus musculus]NSM05601.1 immunoglobulin heavy chain junction region [Mus musculus]NSM05748.1 immunoglobulin heavy chain junction region [Mus musculus]
CARKTAQATYWFAYW